MVTNINKLVTIFIWKDLKFMNIIKSLDVFNFCISIIGKQSEYTNSIYDLYKLGKPILASDCCLVLIKFKPGRNLTRVFIFLMHFIVSNIGPH